MLNIYILDLLTFRSGANQVTQAKLLTKKRKSFLSEPWSLLLKTYTGPITSQDVARIREDNRCGRVFVQCKNIIQMGSYLPYSKQFTLFHWPMMTGVCVSEGGWGTETAHCLRMCSWGNPTLLHPSSPSHLQGPHDPGRN